MRCLRCGAVEICEGKTENDLPYQWFGGEAKQHPFKLEKVKHINSWRALSVIDDENHILKGCYGNRQHLEV